MDMEKMISADHFFKRLNCNLNSNNIIDEEIVKEKWVNNITKDIITIQSELAKLCEKNKDIITFFEEYNVINFARRFQINILLHQIELYNSYNNDVILLDKDTLTAIEMMNIEYIVPNIESDIVREVVENIQCKYGYKYKMVKLDDNSTFYSLKISL